MDARIAVFDFHRTDDLGQRLKSILESSAGMPVALRSVRVSCERGATGNQQTPQPSSNVPADLSFILLPRDRLDEVSEILNQIGVKPETAFIVTEIRAAEETIRLLKLGTADVIAPPVKGADILPRVWRFLQYANAKTTVVHKVKENVGLAGLIGQSAIFLAATKGIPLAARCDASVLITGETGTGKEIFARAVHYLSARARKPFNPVNCGAIPLDLVENELFGHVGGAFTGASAARAGLIAETDGGTLFLDEIDCLPLLAQVKLLRFLQEKEYRPLGSAQMQRADVRIIAASNIDLEDAVRQGKLRQDFYYRLNVFPIDLPPLRERREDIPLLARHFLEKYAGEFNKQVTDFDAVSMRMLMQCDWPGNVRELEHIIQRAVVLSEEGVVQSSVILVSRPVLARAGISFRQAKAQVIEQFEKTYLENLLMEHSGNISKAARAAQKNRRAFFELLRKYRIQRQAPVKAKGQQAS